MPRVAFVCLTSRCNQNCPWCFYQTGYLNQFGPEPSLKLLAKRLKKLHHLGITRLILTGGEPLVRTDLPECVSLAGKLGFKTHLLTNGVGLDDEVTSTLIQAGLNQLSISVHDLSRLEALGNISFPPGWLITAISVVSHSNLKQIPDLIKKIRKKGWGHILQPVFIPPYYKKKADYSLSDQDVEIFLSLLKNQRSRDKRYLSAVSYVLGGGGNPPDQCFISLESMVLELDGSIYPCFHRRDLKAGNLDRDSLITISKKLKNATQLLKRASCFGCHCVSLFTP